MHLFVKKEGKNGLNTEQDYLRIDSLCLSFFRSSVFCPKRQQLYAYFTDDREELLKRQEMIADLRKNSALRQCFKETQLAIAKMQKNMNMVRHITVPLRNLLASYYLFCDYRCITNKLIGELQKVSLCAGFSTFLEELKSEQIDSGILLLLHNVENQNTDWMRVRGVEIGVNISILPHLHTEAVILREHREAPYDDSCIFDGDFGEDAGITRLVKAELGEYQTFFDRMILRDFRHRYKHDIAAFENAMGTEHDFTSVQRICDLLDQISILLAGVEYEQLLESFGYPTCTPILLEQKNQFYAEGIYPILLAVSGNNDAVANDIQLSDKFYILTGANHSGKTELLITIAQAQILAQLGLNVPCGKLETGLVPAIHTLFSGGEDISGNLSRMGVEAARFADIMNGFESGSLVLLNEPMTSTNPEEGAKICADMMKKITNSGGFGIIVTHLYELLSIVGDGCDSLVMEVEQEGDNVRRTFKVHPRLPYCQSYALELAQQAGLCDPQDTERMAFLQTLAEQVVQTV